MGRLTSRRLKLDGRVMDVEAIAQTAVDLCQDGGALRRRHLRNGDMAGQCMRLRSQAPDVEVVHIEYSFNGLHRLAYGAEL